MIRHLDAEEKIAELNQTAASNETGMDKEARDRYISELQIAAQPAVPLASVHDMAAAGIAVIEE